MAIIPPWLNVSPNDFVQAAQAGAATGLQLAGLRQRGALEEARLAQAAAEAEANRSSVEARAAQALSLQQWEREMMDRARAAALAQQGQQAAATLTERVREADLANALGLQRAEATKEHYQQIEENQANKIKAALNIPVNQHIVKVGNDVIAIDPKTLEQRTVFSAPGKTKASGVTAHGVYVTPGNKELGTLSGPIENPAILQALGTNLPPALRGLMKVPQIKVLGIERE